MVLGNLDRFMQKNELRPPFTPHTRINSKWINDLNVRHEIIKIVEENIGSKISDIAHSNILSNICISSGKGNKRKNKQMGLHQIKEFLNSKGNHPQNKKTTHGRGEHIHQYI